MFGFGNRERDLHAELEAAREADADEAIDDTGIDEYESYFNDAEYKRIFETLTLGDLRQKSAEELAGLAALTLAAAENSANMHDGSAECLAELAADYTRSSALSNMALLKHAGITF
jgi:hypothetical protein